MSQIDSLSIGVDIGGTFTDFVIYSPQDSKIETFKLLSTPQQPARAVLEGLERIAKDHPGSARRVIHGSTVATNALLERKGARTALVTTRGFRDVLQIGRQSRPSLYDLFASPLPPLAPSGLRFEVDERVGPQGEVIVPLAEQEVEALIPILRSQEVESVAIGFLFSFANPAHERRAAEILRQAGFFVSPSHEILPEYREYERFSTTTVNAYVSLVLDRYLTTLQSQQPDIRMMQSNGGNISLAEARHNGVRCILSGPAGGVVGASYIAKLAFQARLSTGLSPIDDNGLETFTPLVKIISFDMGGTSTDVSLIDGEPKLTTEAAIGGCPIRIPVLDIHTIGAGGGSIAYLDPGGALRVGPQSAGADPGPACYGKGDLPTVTDANLALGRLDAQRFLGEEMPLDETRARRALRQLGDQMGLTANQAALGIIEIANAHMERALRVISVERGHDPRIFTLLSFGGAGGLHACSLARRLGVPRVLVPPQASTLSALGMLAANVVKDYSLTVMLPGTTPPEELAEYLAPLVERGMREVAEEGIPLHEISIERMLDMRYQGQSYELTVPFSETLIEDFHASHHRAYGYSQDNAPVEIVNLRLQATGRLAPPVLAPQAMDVSDPTPAFLETRPVTLSEGLAQVPFYDAAFLHHGNQLAGPAIILRSDTTILLEEGDHGSVDAYGNLLIAVHAPVDFASS